MNKLTRVKLLLLVLRFLRCVLVALLNTFAIY